MLKNIILLMLASLIAMPITTQGQALPVEVAVLTEAPNIPPPITRNTPAKVVIKKVTKPEKPKNGNTLSYTQSEFVEHVRAFCGLEKRSQAREICDDLALFIRGLYKVYIYRYDYAHNI